MRGEAHTELTSAISDFREARLRAAMQGVLSWITGKPVDLLPFDQARRLLTGESAIQHGLAEIPLDAVVGSVGRYRDFTRSFLPRRSTDAMRWARLKSKIPEIGFNPIEVYKVGQAYFVLDGNHRVSIARARGDETIQAYVTEIPTRVELQPDDDLDDLIRKVEQADFLESTGLDQSRPESDFTVTAPGSYRSMFHRIERYREYFPELEWRSAAEKWHDEEYRPVVGMIAEKGVNRDFPGRTEADLYAWIIRRRADLADEIGHEVSLAVTAEEMRQRDSPRAGRVARRVGRSLARLITPDPLEPGPRAGRWRQWALATHRKDHLFKEYIVPISGSENSWLALEQALIYAAKERDFIYGLHVVKNGNQAESEAVARIQTRFEHRLAEHGLSGELLVKVGRVSQTICAQTCFVDLLIMDIAEPPGGGPLEKISSRLHRVIQQACRPIILVPALKPKIERLLLAYDGSPKAKEALFVSTYLAGKWKLEIDVLTVLGGRATPENLGQAGDYLRKHGIEANSIVRSGDPGEIIIQTAQERGSDEIIMGGYGHTPLLEIVLGSAVDHVIRESAVPVFVCI